MATREEIEEWLGRCSVGDRAAFERLYRATSAKLFAVVLRVLNDRGEAEETLQEVYARIWKNAGSYQVNGLSPMTWLITVARNAAVDRRRRRDARGGPTSELPETLADRAPGPEAATVARSEAARLSACLDELDRNRADAVRGAYLGESYKELASRFGVPLNTMRTWLRRSLIALRECMSR